jgi:hypothetical protein
MLSIKDLAQQVFEELQSPTDLSVSSIAFWMVTNIGQLNNMIGKSYGVTSEGTDITPLLGYGEKAIYKQLYVIHFYSSKIRENLGASAINSAIEVDNFGTRVRLQNKNEVAKSWLTLKKQAQDDLDKQIKDYNKNQFSPVQIAGDDTTYSTNGGLSNSLTSDSIY